MLAPPSIHPSGKKYAWSANTARAFADAPDWLYSVVSRSDSERSKPAFKLDANTIGEGQRNDTLARIIGCLLRRGVEPRLAQKLTLSFNAVYCQPPLARNEALQVIESIAQSEARRRGFSDV